jgi:hypothetical protein
MLAPFVVFFKLAILFCLLAHRDDNGAAAAGLDPKAITGGPSILVQASPATAITYLDGQLVDDKSFQGTFNNPYKAGVWIQTH